MADSFNYDQFESSLLAATEACFQTFTKKKDSQDVCGFALYSDDSASSISASANVQKHLAKVTEEDPDEAMAYKWSPAEWKYESIASKRLDTLSDQLMNVATTISDEAFDTHRAAIFDRCVDVLKKLKQDGLFKSVADNFVLLFDVSDYDDEASQIKWVESLNDTKLAKEFSQLISDDE